MEIIYTKAAMKDLQPMTKQLRERIIASINQLPSGDVRRLQGYNNTYRLRIGDYRVLFSMDGNDLTVRNVLPRGEAYKR